MSAVGADCGAARRPVRVTPGSIAGQLDLIERMCECVA